MIGWIIAGSIVLLAVILLICPVYLSVHLGSENKITAGYLMIRFPIYPRKAHEMKEEQEAEDEKTSQKTQQEKKKAKATFTETFELIVDLARASASPLFHLLKRTYLTRLDLNVEVGGEDAADIALSTTKYRAAASYFIGLFRTLHLLKWMKRCSIAPNFLKEETQYEVHFCLMWRLSTIIYAVITAGFRYIKLQFEKEPDTGLNQPEMNRQSKSAAKHIP